MFCAGVYMYVHAYARVHASDRLIQSEVPGLATVTASRTEVSTHLHAGQWHSSSPLAVQNQAC